MKCTTSWATATSTAYDAHGADVDPDRNDRRFTDAALAEALTRRGWQLDEDGEGATLRLPPGTTATDVAFEVLAVLTVAGAPTAPRSATGSDATGAEIDLRPPA